jgi:Tol biopolymer transport system component
MTAPDRFDRHFSDLLAELAEPEFPDYFDDVLARAVRPAQRPAWMFPERWFPMSAIARRSVLAPSVPWRTVGLVVILALLLAAALVAIGAQRRTPPPFGLARNGVVAYTVNGDIYTSDPATGVTNAIVVGPSNDLSPAFSLDGTKLAFIRVVAPNREMLMVSDVDGSNVHNVTDTRNRLGWWEWSPDGSRIAFVDVIDDLPTISVVAADASAPPRALEIGMPAELVEWRPPDGSELIFRGTQSGKSGIFAIDPDGGTPRPLTPTDGHLEFGYMGGYSLSPDGTRLAYTEWEDLRVLRVHLLNLVTGDDQTRIGPDEEGFPVFSPDGRLLAFYRQSSSAVGIPVRIYVGPVDDASAATAVGPESATDQSGDVGLTYDFSPDGTQLLITSFREEELHVADVTGGEGTVLAETNEPPSWQRKAL